jgi:glycosyltransferase involved in cell wall biosynthesis
MATVDVLIPTYNRSTMLRQCLESIQAQTYRDIRVVIGDNCSDDDTRTVAQGFCDSDSRFIYIRNATKLSMYGNVNALITRVVAPCVHIMHDDDWLEPSFYERMVAGLEESPEAGLVWPRVILSQGESEMAIKLPEMFCHDQVLTGETTFEELLHGCFITFSAAVVRTSLLREMGPFSEYLSADWLMYLRMALRCNVKFIDAPLFYRRLHEGQTSADIVRMGRDNIDMFVFASGLEEFSGRQTEIAAAGFESVCSDMIGMKEEPHAPRLIRELTSYYLRHVPDHHNAIRRVEIIAFAYAVIPVWLRPHKGGRLRHWFRNLVLPWGRE